MSDATLRTLRRRWHETGAAEDESRYLLELVRSGTLPQVNLRLAALMGCPPAVMAMGPGPDQLFIDDWLKQVRDTAGDAWTPNIQLRCAHAAAWVAAITIHAEVRADWMSGAIGRLFQLTAYRILGGLEPEAHEVITPLNQEHVELVESFRRLQNPRHADDVAAALFVMRNAAAGYSKGEDPSTLTESCRYLLKFAEGVLMTDGIYHSCAFLVGPYLLYGEDPMLWWREGVRTLHGGLNLFIRRSPWYEDAVA